MHIDDYQIFFGFIISNVIVCSMLVMPTGLHFGVEGACKRFKGCLQIVQLTNDIQKMYRNKMKYQLPKEKHKDLKPTLKL
jgi:hypothetical protein